MRYFEGKIMTNRVGSECKFEFEVEDDATEEEIEETARFSAFEYVDWGFKEIKKKEKKKK